MSRIHRPKRTRISVTINDDLLRWVDRIVGIRKPIRNRSHAVELCLEKLKEQLRKDAKAGSSYARRALIEKRYKRIRD